jgi:hypothetical protein
MYSRNRLCDKAYIWWVNVDWKKKEEIVLKNYMMEIGISSDEVDWYE